MGKPREKMTPQERQDDILDRLTRIETRLVRLIYALGFTEIINAKEPDRDHDRQP